MKLQQRIEILKELGDYMASDEEAWMKAKAEASIANSWFLPQFIDLAVNGIVSRFLNKNSLESWAQGYKVPDRERTDTTVGVVMAGNIPLVGFHDFLCIFISGLPQKIKLSEKDTALMKHLIEWMHQRWPQTVELVSISALLKGCDAYIATGSNNSSRYFEQYFGKFPNIIRRNRTSVAILDGSESAKDLDLLADDIQQYFGLGCRNVTQLYVPENYDFVPVLDALKKYDYFMDQHKYKHNYDYNLAIPLINHSFYMTNGSVLLIRNKSLFSPISQVNYEFYTDKDKLTDELPTDQIQCIVGKDLTPFGSAQLPSLTDYADGVDTMRFLQTLQ